MDSSKIVRTKKSVRAYKDKWTEKSIIDKVISAASNALSYSNTRPWEIAVGTGEERKELAHSSSGIQEEGSTIFPLFERVA